MSLPAFTKEQQEIVDYVHGKIPANGHLVYDLTDDKQYQYACLMNEMNGMSKKDYPATYKLLDDIKAHQQRFGYQPTAGLKDSKDGWTTAYSITGAGENGTGKATAAGLGTVVGGFKALNMGIYVQDAATKSILANGSSAALAPLTTKTVETNASTAYPISSDYTTYLHYSCLPAANELLDASTLPGNVGTVSKRGSNAPVADPEVTAPKYKELPNPYGGKTNNILIGLGRQWTTQGTQFNYVWAEPNVSHPLGRVPLVGNVTFKKDIAALVLPTATHPGNISVSLSVTDQTGGGLIAPTNDQLFNNIYPNFSLVPGDSKSLQWNLPPGTGGSDKGNPVVFTQITWPSDISALFNCDIQVTFTDGTLGYASISSTPSGIDTNKADGVTVIHPIEFIWHCVGEDTLVTLEAGKSKSTKPIKDFVTGDQVICNDSGEKRVISAVHKGDHKGEILAITTDQGQSLIISHNHLVMTPGGGVRASALEEGCEVLAEGGVAIIESVERELVYDKDVYNLYVGEYTDKEPGAFYANGILVGDIAAQVKMTEQLSTDLEWLIAELGEEWETDIRSHLASQGVC